MGALATSSRNTLETPPINNFDITAAKHFRFGERYGIDFMAQAFNIFNHPQFVTGKINDVESDGVTGAARNFFIPNSGGLQQSLAELQQQSAHHAVGSEVPFLGESDRLYFSGGSFEPPDFLCFNSFVKAYFPNIG